MKKSLQSLMLAFIFVFLSTTGLVYATETEYIKLETSVAQTLDISDDAISGSHTFSLTARSHNFPYSTVSRSWNFTY